MSERFSRTGEALQDIVDDLIRSSPEALAVDLIETVADLRSTQKRCVELQDARDNAQARVDLFHRRGELSIAILRDDEAGLTRAVLDQIAAIIWPAPKVSVIDEPTKIEQAPTHVHKVQVDSDRRLISSFCKCGAYVADVEWAVTESERLHQANTEILRLNSVLGVAKQLIDRFYAALYLDLPTDADAVGEEPWNSLKADIESFKDAP